MTNRNWEFKITMLPVDGMSPNEVRAYIEDAMHAIGVCRPPDDPYCGTALEAINFALNIRDDYSSVAFLRDWNEGDLSEWPEFKFEPERQSAGAVDEAAVELACETYWNHGENHQRDWENFKWHHPEAISEVKAGIRAALEAVRVSTPPIPAPGGEMVMVPRLPTKAMINAAYDQNPRDWRFGAMSIWEAMLAAAPTEKKGAA